MVSSPAGGAPRSQCFLCRKPPKTVTRLVCFETLPLCMQYKTAVVQPRPLVVTVVNYVVQVA